MQNNLYNLKPLRQSLTEICEALSLTKIIFTKIIF